MHQRKSTQSVAATLARAETQIHKGEDLTELPRKGEEQDEDLLMLSPAHVVGPCCFYLGGGGETIRDLRELMKCDGKVPQKQQ